jgi:membrane protein required for colicin V production
VHWFDIAILGTCAILFVDGLIRGVILQLFGIAAIVLGLVAASVLYIEGARLISPVVGSEGAAELIAFVLIFIIVLIVVNLMGRIVRKVSDFAHLKFIERLLGGVLGVLKALVLWCVLLMLLAALLPGTMSAVSKSEIGPRLLVIGERVVATMPEKFEEEFRDGMRQLDRLRDEVRDTIDAI